MKKIITLVALALFVGIASAQEATFTVENHKYAVKDSAMYFDLYKPIGVSGANKTVVYVFGGGFITGDKRDKDNLSFFKSLTNNGFNVIAIDYRLGLKGVKKVGVTNPRPPFEAVKMAAEDLTSALQYIIENQTGLGVDTSKIVLIGSSAGAITILQTNYEMSNRSDMVKNLPENFKVAGVVSMAGAIFSTKGIPKYKTAPAPTFFLHGTADKIVVYKKIKFFSLAMAGSDALSKEFAKRGYPFVIYRYEDCRHEVADFPRYYALKEIL